MASYDDQIERVSRERVRRILFFDGTRNDRRSDTNIYRLYQRLSSESADGFRQEWRYWTGVGIKPWEQVRGGAFGLHLSKKIKEGYEWLAEHHSDGDEIHIFGFSRGAFTAMGLVGLLAWRGLPKAAAPRGALKEQFDLYRQGSRKAQEEGRPGSRSLGELLSLSDEAKGKLNRQDRDVMDTFRSVPIKFVGLFDTVRAAGLEVFRWGGKRLPPEVPPGEHLTPGTLALRYTRHLPENVEQAFQALAVDEHRAVFHPRVWIVPATRKPPPKGRIVEQRWFIGAHANVGGGYRDDRLASIPLRWMQEKAKEAGIRFTTEEKQLAPADWQRAEMRKRESYAEWLFHAYQWVSWSPYDRPIYAWGIRHEAPPIEYEPQTIDESVLHRILEDPGYRPKNVKTCLDRLREGKVVLETSTALLVGDCLKVKGW